MDTRNVGEGGLGQVAGDVDLDAECSLEQRVRAAGRDAASSALRILDLLTELEESEGFRPRYRDAATWLAWHLGMAPRTARLYVRIARKLHVLPIIRQAFGAGRISFDHVQELVRTATEDSEGALVELAVASDDLDELRELISERSVPESEPEPTDAPRIQTVWRDDALHLRGTIPGADGVMVEKALLTVAARAPKDPHTGLFRDPDIRVGEALVQIASEALATDGDHDRSTVVVHIPAADLVSQRGAGWDAARRIFPAEELQRLACDARLQPSLHDRAGITVGVGRTTRAISPWLRRLMEGRDRGCRFPGCGQTRWIHGHHIRPWSQDGPTNLDNLVSLCGFHHRMVHADDWSIAGRPSQRLEFRDRWGSPHTRLERRFPSTFTATLEEGVARQAKQKLVELALAAPP